MLSNAETTKRLSLPFMLQYLRLLVSVMSLSAAKLSAMMREIVLKLFSDHLSADGKVMCVCVCLRHILAIFI